MTDDYHGPPGWTLRHPIDGEWYYITLAIARNAWPQATWEGWIAAGPPDVAN